MRVLITGICGFVGSRLAYFLKSAGQTEIVGLDNLVRPGSEMNRRTLVNHGCRLFHGDVRLASDFESLPIVDWVIDAAANPSVLAGIDGKSSSRQVTEHNLVGTLNLLEFCRRSEAGLILLSTSRVYSIPALANLPLRAAANRFELTEHLPAGVTERGINELFSTSPPISLYGATKLASETIALEYGFTFGLPVWIDRCGVLAGAGQFGTAEQGIFSFWLHSWRAKRPLRYIGFEGTGKQVRDAFHPDDLGALVWRQLQDRRSDALERTWNVGGGLANSRSLAELSEWSEKRFGTHTVQADAKPRPFDIPWVAMDASRAQQRWDWRPQIPLDIILSEIADHADANPDWFSRVAG